MIALKVCEQLVQRYLLFGEKKIVFSRIPRIIINILILKQKNNKSAGNRMFFRRSKINCKKVSLVLWDVRNALVPFAALCDFYSHLQETFLSAS